MQQVERLDIGIWSGRALLVAVICAFLLVSNHDAAAAGDINADVVVAPDGNDANPGTLEKPLATFAGAKDAVQRRLASGRREDITVLFRGGIYPMFAPIAFGPADSARDAQTITYAAYPGETPVFSGGKRITGWTKTGDVWTASIPEAREGKWPFRRLYVGDSSRTLARIPNEGDYFRVAAQMGESPDRGFRGAPDDLREWPHLLDANVVSLIKWKSCTIPIAGFDPRTNKLKVAGASNEPFVASQRYYVENLPEALDAPGEWHLDRKEGILSYIAKAGEDPNKLEIVAPLATSFLCVKGTARDGRRIHGLRFRGLHFRHGDYVLEPTGHSDGQGENTVPAAITFFNVENCVFEQSEVSCIGTYAIEVAAGCEGIRFERNELRDMGAGGVIVRAGSRAITIHNNFIHDGGSVYYAGTPVFIQDSSDNVVTHNEICDFNWLGISVGWSWGFAPTKCHNNRIEYNYLHHLGRGVMTDIGAIYTLGESTGTVIRNNLIHHVWDCAEGYLACGIYLDQGSRGLLIENNVVYGTAWGGLNVHFGRDNTVRNNIFASGRTCQVTMGRAKNKNEYGFLEFTTSSMTFERNIVLYNRGNLFRRDTELTADSNLYWNTAGAVVFPGEADFPTWQARGRDVHSLVADPRFVDPANGDFRLRPDSPALTLGFKPIDTLEIGLTGDAAWVARPRTIQRAPVTIPPRWNPFMVLSIDDDFETTETGEQPQHVQVHRADKRMSIALSDEAAASGKQCLKFQDVAGPFGKFFPYMNYSVDATSGVAHGSFDVRLEKGASIGCEWRNADSDPFISGPTLVITPDGSLLANEQKVMEVPLGQWMHLDIACALGDKADGTYTLSVTLPGKPPQTFDRLPCDPRFERMNWIGFSSPSIDTTVFYVDNVKFTCSSR